MAEFVVARLATAKTNVTLLENTICLPMKHKNSFNTYLWICGEMEFDQDQKILGERKLEYVQERESVIRLVLFQLTGKSDLFFYYGSTNRREHLKNSLCN